jgi:hypothetical protein
VLSLSELHPLLQRFGSTLEEIAESQERLAHSLQQSFIHPLEAFCAKELDKVSPAMSPDSSERHRDRLPTVGPGPEAIQCGGDACGDIPSPQRRGGPDGWTKRGWGEVESEGSSCASHDGAAACSRHGAGA